MSDLARPKAGATVRAALCLSIAATTLGACGSTTTHTHIVNRVVSKDQALFDLQRARNAGAITPSEYRMLRAKTLAQ